MSSNDTLELCEDLLATLEAADAQLHVLAANALPFNRAARARRRARARARQLLVSLDVGLGLGDDDTDEILARGGVPSQDLVWAATALGAAAGAATALDDGDEAPAGYPAPDTDEQDFEDPVDGSLVSFPDDEDTAAGYEDDEDDDDGDDASDPDTTPGPLHGAGDDLSGLVVFDEITDPQEDEDEDDDLLGDLPPLPPMSDDLVRFDEEEATPAVAEPDDGDTVPEPAPASEPTAGPTVESVDEDALVDASLEDEAGGDELLLDLQSLSNLQHELYEDEDEEEDDFDDDLDDDPATPVRQPAPTRATATPGAPIRDIMPDEASLQSIEFDDSAMSSSLEGDDSEADPAPATVAVPASDWRNAAPDEDDLAIELGAADEEDDPDGQPHDEDDEDAFSMRLRNTAAIAADEEIGDEPSDVDQAVPAPVAPVPEEPGAEAAAAMLAEARQTLDMGDMHTAAELFSDVLDIDQDNIEAHLGRGRIYLDLGDFARAMSDFTVAEDLAPSSPEPQVAIGDMYFARKDYRKAIEYFDAAIGMSPDHAMAHCRRGISHYYRKSYGRAVDDLTRAQRLDGTIPNIKTYVAMAKKKTG